MSEGVLGLIAPWRDDSGWAEDGGALSPAAGWNALRQELDRSRRFDHEFVLMRMERVHRNGDGEVDLAQRLPPRLRSIDSVWAVHEQLFILLPEADRDVAVALLGRLRRESPGLLPGDVRLAAFPADGLTGGALQELLNRPSPREDGGLDAGQAEPAGHPA